MDGWTDGIFIDYTNSNFVLLWPQEGSIDFFKYTPESHQLHCCKDRHNTKCKWGMQMFLQKLSKDNNDDDSGLVYSNSLLEFIIWNMFVIKDRAGKLESMEID